MRRKTGVVAAVTVCAVVLGAVVSANYLGLVVAPQDTTRFVPADAGTAVRVNTTALGDDPNVDRLLETALGTGYDGLLGSVEDRTGIGTDSLLEATFFVGTSRTDSTDEGSYAGVVFRTEPGVVDVRGLETFDVERSSYNLVPFYTVRSNATEDARPFYATTVGRGVYVVGTERAVRDASDVAWRSAEALDPPLRDELTSAPVTFVATDAPLADTSTVSGSYRPDPRPNGTSLRLELRPSVGADVGDVRRTVGVYVTAARLTNDARLNEVLDSTEVYETSSSVVTEYTGSTDGTASAFRVFDARFGWTDALKNSLRTVGLSGVFGSPNNVTEGTAYRTNITDHQPNVTP